MDSRKISRKNKAMSHHMMTMMGIRVWVDKNQPTTMLNPKAFSRLGDDLPNDECFHRYFVKKIEQAKAPIHSEIHSQNKAIIHAPNVAKNTMVAKNTVHDDVANYPKQTNDACFPVHLMDVHLLQDRFDLLAIAFNDWILIADKAILTTAELGIANNLADKLMAKGALFLKSHYPLVKDKVSSKNAQATLMGFLLRLYDGKRDVRIGLLNKIQTIDFGQLQEKMISIPSLQQMYRHPEGKRFLWALLHEPIDND